MGAKPSTPNMVPPVIVPPRLKHTASLIFLHGLGDTGDGWAQALRNLNLANIRCVCPNATSMPVTLNGGMRMPSWFDLYNLKADATEDKDGIIKASALISELISAEENDGIPSRRIMLGGFSQGGALALYTSFVCGKPLAGVVGLSTYLPLRRSFPDCIVSNKDVPIFQGHGTMDPLIPCEWGQITHRILGTFNPNCVFKSYKDVMHGSCDEELNDVKLFIEKYLPD